jgi:hypothetical protein
MVGEPLKKLAEYGTLPQYLPAVARTPSSLTAIAFRIVFCWDLKVIMDEKFSA